MTKGLLIMLGIAVWLPACEDEFAITSKVGPLIEATRPERAGVGSEVTLIGRNFGVQGDRDGVWLAGVPVPVESWRDRELLVRIPASAGRGFGDFVVRSGAQVSAPLTFEVLRASPAEDAAAPDGTM